MKNNITHKSIIFEVYDNTNQNRYIGFRKKYKDEGDRNLTCDYFSGSGIKYHQNTEVAILMTFPSDIVLQKEYLRNIKNYIVYKRKKYFERMCSENKYIMYTSTNIRETDRLEIPVNYLPLYNFCVNNIDKAINYIHKKDVIPSRKGAKLETLTINDECECTDVISEYKVDNKPKSSILNVISFQDSKGIRECTVHISYLSDGDINKLTERGFKVEVPTSRNPCTYAKITW